MIIENPEALKTWLTSCLAGLCDADPAALAKYVMALVKKDKAENELKSICLDQLDVFLLKETKGFVDLLFETLQTKSYLKQEPPNPLLHNEEKTLSSPSYNGSTSALKQSFPSDITVKSEISDRRFKDDSRSPEHHTSKTKISSKETKVRSRSRSPLRKSIIRHRSRSRENDFKRRSISDEDKGKSSRGSNRLTYKDRHSGDTVKDHAKKEKSNQDKKREPEYKNMQNQSDLSQPHQRDHGDTDYRLNSRCMPSVIQTTQNSHIEIKGKRRCQDYDEKGFCMRGDMCIFDHGADPLVVEDVSVLNFGSTGSSQASSRASETIPEPETQPPPPPPGSPPPLPPPPSIPPPPPPVSFIPEPYNPEAPEMNLTPCKQVNYWMPSNLHHPPPLNEPPPKLPIFNIHEPPPSYHNGKIHRARELVGVPTIGEGCDSSFGKNIHEQAEMSGNQDNLLHIKSSEMNQIPSSVTNVTPNFMKRKGFNYNRLGPVKIPKFKNNDRCTLEVRKIPTHLNKIALLNDHFTKFGTVVNLQVCYDGDPEAALIQFENHNEATAAYRSTEAVLNNRFVKVFWHNKETNIGERIIRDTSMSFCSEISDSSENVKMARMESHNTERSVVFTPKGNLSRTVFNPTVLKKNNVYLQPRSINTAGLKKQKEDQRRETFLKKVELHRKKQDFLQSQIGHQKMLLEKLAKCKNDKEKEFLKEAMMTLEAQITSLQTDVRKDSQELSKLLKIHGVKAFHDKTEAKKELLDAEMDLYNKQREQKGDDTAELVSKVQFLRKKAKTLGLFDSTPYARTPRGTRRGSFRFQTRPHVLQPSHTSASPLCLDNRTRRVIASSTAEKEDVVKHFSVQLSEVENIEQSKSGYILTFKTRKEAEQAMVKCSSSQPEEIISSMSWYQDSGDGTASSQNIESLNVSEKDSKDEQIHEVEDEEEDEVSEARSWRQ